MPQKGHARHDDLPQEHQHPRVQGGRDIEKPKDASLNGPTDVVVNHNEAEDDSRKADGTLVCQLHCVPASAKASISYT